VGSVKERANIGILFGMPLTMRVHRHVPTLPTGQSTVFMSIVAWIDRFDLERTRVNRSERPATFLNTPTIMIGWPRSLSSAASIHTSLIDCLRFLPFLHKRVFQATCTRKVRGKGGEKKAWHLVSGRNVCIVTAEMPCRQTHGISHTINQ